MVDEISIFKDDPLGKKIGGDPAVNFTRRMELEQALHPDLRTQEEKDSSAKQRVEEQVAKWNSTLDNPDSPAIEKVRARANIIRHVELPSDPDNEEKKQELQGLSSKIVDWKQGSDVSY